MPFSKAWFFLLSSLVISPLIISSHSLIAAAQADDTARRTTSIGVIIDADSRAGKEQKTAMLIAVQTLNNSSSNSSNANKLFLHFKDSGGDPFRAASAAEELIKQNKVKVIIGMDTWEEESLVAEIGKRNQVPVISFATPAISPPLSLLRWPFLLRMASSNMVEMDCIAAIVHSYKWKRVVVIAEDGAYRSDSGEMALLSEALQDIGAVVEHRLVLPPAKSLVDPKGVVIGELEKLKSRQPKVFIVLHSSVSLAAHIIKEAQRMGLMEKESAWIVSDAISSLLDSFNSAVMLSLNGALGVKSYYGNTKPFRAFSEQFRKRFRAEYLKEDKFMPGIHALRAYDSIRIVSDALDKPHGSNNTSSTPKAFFQNMLSSDFTGLSGKIGFKKGESSHSPVFTIVNVIGNGYRELASWTPRTGFSSNTTLLQEAYEKGSTKGNGTINVLTTSVIWPGDLERTPKGRAVPIKKLLIGVPGRTSFEKFVKVDGTNFSGFCIAVFNETVKLVEKNYSVPYEFRPYNTTYDELVDLVSNKTVDAIVGDITILAKRMEHVEFTQPFAVSGLSIIVPVKVASRKAWIFVRPFTMEMWVVTGSILLYTMFIVWFLEHRTNPNFRGAWKDQLGTALWFTFSSLFFAHRERINSNFTRIVVVVWLFVVLILTSSYTASLSSMLTVDGLEPNVTDINWLRTTNQKIGCDGDSFVRKYLQNVLHFKSENILNVSTENDYPAEFEAHNITAAFLELPYAKAYLDQYCKGYTVTNPTYRFGGLAFAFQKGSPLAKDFSEAILAISENGTLKRLEEVWFPPTPQCSAAMNGTESGSLGLQSFWGLYVITGGTSTICLLVSLVRLINSFCRWQDDPEPSATPVDNSVWGKAKRLAHYFHEGKFGTPGRSPTAASVYYDGQNSPRWVSVTTCVSPEHPQTSSASETDTPQQNYQPQASTVFEIDTQQEDYQHQALFVFEVETQQDGQPQALPAADTQVL